MPALLHLQETFRAAPAAGKRVRPRATLSAMALRRPKPRNACQRLRRAVDAMPRASREAMLRGIDDNTIIVGAYTDPRSGGICPMLAAHRNGGRTDLASFARSWDRYTDARRPRPATRREIRTLRSLLEMSLIADDSAESLTGAAAEIRAARDARAPERAPALPPRIAPPERDGMLIRIRRLRAARRERRRLAAAAR
jgi:hypothetical protein